MNVTISARRWLAVCLAVTSLGGPGAAAEPPFPQSAGLPPSVTHSIQYRRWLWHRQDRVLPDGRVPHRARERALEQIRQSRDQSLFHPAAVVPGNAWSPIGPAPIFNGQTSGSQPVSGRIGDIAVNPSNASHWVVGTAQGGLWETINAGASWKPKSDDQASLAFGAVAFAPSATNILYAGTGEEVFSGDSVSGAGLLKSTNSGATWQLLAVATFSGTTFSTLRVHPTDPNVLLASTARGIYKSVNGAANWTQKLAGTATDIEVDSGNFTNQYCAIGSTGGGAANGVYRSINLGETWTLVTGPWSSSSLVGRIELAISPSSPGTLYVSIANSSTSGLLGIWRTDNAWAATPAWTQLPDPGSGFTSQMWYNHEIIVDPANPATLYEGGVGLKKFNGASWTDVLGTVHVDFHALAWAGSRLIVGSDGGVWSTANGGSAWTDHNSNLQLTQFYHGSISPSDPNLALGGSQDNGTAKWSGTNGWRLIFGGDGADNAIANSNPANYWAVSLQNLEIRRTRNAGASFEDANNGIGATNRPFIGRFEKAPHNDDIFITGTTQIWKTTNFFTGATVAWASNSPDFGAGFRSAAFARSDPADITYACGFSGGALRITTNGGAVWRDLDPLGQVPARSVYDLAFHPTNANILYACLSGLSGGVPANVYRTTNALAASPGWVNLSYPADVPANTIAMDLDDPRILYVGTDIGVWKTVNGGTNWTHMGPDVGMPNVEVDELRLNNATGRLVAFTHGRGAFALIQANTADLALTQSDSADPVSTGCPLTYALNVFNRGPGNAPSVFLTNRLPAGVSFSAATASQGTFSLNGSSVVFSAGTLPALSNAAFTVTVVPTVATTFTNLATVRSGVSDPDPSNNLTTETTVAVVDTGGPGVLSAVAEPDGNSILVSFSEALSPASAFNLLNYSLSDGRTNPVPITSLNPGAAQGTVALEVNLLARPGPFVLTIQGITDCAGNPMSSNALFYVALPAFVLVPAGAVWKYLDDGTDQGIAWRDPAFDDNGWNSGQAQLGYGDGDEKTELSFGADPNAKRVTYYFRHAFVVPDATLLSGLVAGLLRDDGGVVYLNGTEVFRSNLPGGSISNNTLAVAAVTGTNENAFFSSGVLSSNLLITGTNVLAVEIHQNSLASSDVSFDFHLAANLRQIVARPFFLQQPEPVTALVGDTVTFNVAAGGTPPLAYRWRRFSATVVDFPQGTPTLTLTNVQLSSAGPYNVVVSNLASSGVLSPSALLTVLVDIDGDRMPDEWEIVNGFDPGNPADAALDFDGDGLSNLQEYIAGTDPRDASSYLKVDQATADTNGVSLRFFAASNRTYSVEYRGAADSGTWFKLADAPARATNRVETILDPAPAAPQRYYRLVAPRQP